MNKREFGQYFTITNPFTLNPFIEWFNSIPNRFGLKYIEPFAGENNIPRMIDDTVSKNLDWHCFDIDPKENNNYSRVAIEQRDVIADFPSGYSVSITNPPYLAKNSASRRKLRYPDTIYDDLYKLCLKVMLDNVDYVAAIIPETFIVAKLFHERLHSVISLTCKMFDDTGCPVCLALFNKDESDDFSIYRMNEYIGRYSKLCDTIPIPKSNNNWKFNDKQGDVGIICIDNTSNQSIEFVDGSTISPNDIKVSSRAITRVGGKPGNIDLEEFLKKCNSILNQYRIGTNDIFMASFKGLRKDGFYRRRLDFNTAKIILNKALDEFCNS